MSLFSQVPPSAASSQALGVVILCAGASSRMGGPKMLLPWRNTTVIGRLITQWRELGATQIAVVIRPHDTALAYELDRLNFPAENRVKNPRPERGMFSSIVCAAAWDQWHAEISRWAIILGDQPHLQTDTLRTLLEFSARNPEATCQPVVGDRSGHPIVLPKTAFASLKNSAAETLKDFLKLTASPIVQCPLADGGLLLDMDTPEDYKQLIASH
jgi:molybdenum cofactor cytidylyltransferase